MTRVKRGTIAHKRKKSLLKKTKGYQWGRKSKYKLAKQAAIRAGQHQYRHRREKKRTERQLAQSRITSAVREHGISYSSFIHLMKEKGVELDRKVLAQLAQDRPDIFSAVVEEVKKS